MASLILLIASVAMGQSHIATSQPSLPVMSLKHLGSIQLQIPSSPPSAIRSIFDFDMDDRGRFGILRLDSGNKFTFVFVGPDGAIIRETPLGELGCQNCHLPSLRWLGAERWLAFVGSRYQERLKARIIEAKSGAVTTLDDPIYPSSECVAGDRRGGFIVYHLNRGATTDGNPTYAQLISFDASGKQRWRFEGGDFESGRRLPTLASITVTQNGTIVILDDFQLDLHLFSEKGTYIGMVESRMWHSSLQHNDDIYPDSNGGLLLRDCNSFWRVNPEAMVTRQAGSVGVSAQKMSNHPAYLNTQVLPKFENGRALRSTRGARVDPDGKLWVSDGESLFRLDQKGGVDRTLGDRPSDQYLTKLMGAEIDNHRRTYLLNDRTGSVHVFDRTGKLSHLCKPNPDDFGEVEPSSLRMSVGNDGEVYLWGGQNRFLRFSKDGKRVALDLSRLVWTSGRLHFQPQSPMILWERSNNLYLSDREGAVAKTIDKRADNEPIERIYSFCVAWNGEIAVIAGPLNKPKEGKTVSVYSKIGDGVKSVDVPITSFPNTVAYNGQYVVIGTWFDKCPFIINVATGETKKLACPGDPNEKIEWLGGWVPYFVDQGRELWLFRFKDRRIERYASPGR